MSDSFHEKMTCCICLEEMTHDDCTIQLSCHHKFHFDCLREASRRHRRCPLCRQRSIPNFRPFYTPMLLSIPLTSEFLLNLFNDNPFLDLANFESDSDSLHQNGSESESGVGEQDGSRRADRGVDHDPAAEGIP